MNNKKVGVTLIVLGLVLGGIVFSMAQSLEAQAAQQECNPNQQCKEIATGLGWSHIGIGALGAILALGIYLVFFNTSEKAILERLEAEKEKKLAQERLAIMMQALDDNEKEILKAIAEQDGITQKTLRFRTGLSKSKISQVLSSFEKKGIVKRESKGKTYAIHLTQPI